MKINVNGRELSVSMGNSKMGKVMNFSLFPGWTCSHAACLTCYKHGCYAKSICDRRKNVSQAWWNNTATVIKCEADGRLDLFVKAICDDIAKKKPDAFRIHVGGDFYSRDYFKAWVEIAKSNPDVKFFAFTKQFDNVKGVALPENFALIASSWTGLDIPKWALKRLPMAWLVEHGKPVPVRADRKAYICQGDCTKCHWCFELKKSKGDVAFLLHR